MFLCRRATGLGWKYRWNFAGAAEVGIKPPAAAAAARCGAGSGAGTLRTLRGSAGFTEGLNRSSALSPAGRALAEGLAGRRKREFAVFPREMLPQSRSFSLFPSRSVSAAAPQSSNSRFPGINSPNPRFPARHCAPGHGVLPRASSASQKQANTEKTAPNPELKRIKPTDIPQEEPEPDKKKNKTAQLKKVFKEYGAVGVSFHVGISLISLGIFYLAVSSGINMTALLCKLGFSESVVQSKLAAGTSTFVLAYAVHKLFAPLRISITLVSVPLIVRHLRRTGLFKPPPSSL